ncbi:hypothetical protein [Mucilaginibacter aquariorum]|uniref:Methyl-accepting transducer domain-containing protein n=1 Tax=Mucilaginibacter aquariorum TaxID=2967225 RepID=A0ABT1SVN8_9SPHI|nr:hypothetical protein [Mucilaginibacter aquariorum]MCQ6956411.1 hypothetical protein [Mucilaginibacter aquariorum]
MNESINTAAAASAANIQVSTNRIVKLASDVGNICSMLNTADFKSDSHLAIQAIEPQINAIAYDAELLSLSAMEISAMAAESADISREAEDLFSKAKAVGEKLTETVDQITKFERLVEVNKARNPLIPDDLIKITRGAALDGMNAEILFEVALRSINTLVIACQNN